LNLGPLEIGIVLLIVLVIFGPKRLPQLGRSLGSGMREFKDAVTGRHKDDEPDELEAGQGSGDNVARASTDDAQRAKAADAS
jgi:sec-independent protein translocase protein TatA